MKERPKGIANIYEVEGDRDIIVVIPTADFNGKYARECRENIFKGLHMVFVESGEVPDPYFNYAHNCNVGIKKAMEYNPKWVVVSNDDMVKIDDVKVLKSQLDDLNNQKYDVVFPTPSDYHTYPLYISKIRSTYKIYQYLKKRQERILYDKFTIDFTQSFYTVKSKLVFRKICGTEMTVTSAFAVLSSKYIRNLGNYIFDETYINDHEDLDLSFRFTLNKNKNSKINYNIKALQGSTIGINVCRDLRSVAGRVYFNFKYNRLFNYMLN
jgi:GT2 family glycosyltransferase